MIHELGGIVIKIYNERIMIDTYHESEYSVNNIQNYDYLIENNSNIKQLYNKIYEIYFNNIEKIDNCNCKYFP